jgi:hypothetical protein
MCARIEAAFLTRPTTGSVRGTRTTPLRDDRAVSLCIKPTPAPPPVEEPRQSPWLACFIGLSIILALVNVFIPPVTQEGPQFSADKAVAQVQKAEYALLPRLLPPWHWELLPFSLSTDAQGRPSFWVKARRLGAIQTQPVVPSAEKYSSPISPVFGRSLSPFTIPRNGLRHCKLPRSTQVKKILGNVSLPNLG